MAEINPETGEFVEKIEKAPLEGAPSPEAPKKSGKKIWLFLLVFLIVIALAGVGYWFFTQKDEDLADVQEVIVSLKVSPTPTVVEEALDDDTHKLESQSASDEISAIEADLKATDLTGLDKELETIDQEFETP